jgi:hypothetical protein
LRLEREGKGRKTLQREWVDIRDGRQTERDEGRWNTLRERTDGLVCTSTLRSDRQVEMSFI